jgi:hypothetical protein
MVVALADNIAVGAAGGGGGVGVDVLVPEKVPLAPAQFGDLELHCQVPEIVPLVIVPFPPNTAPLPLWSSSANSASIGDPSGAGSAVAPSNIPCGGNREVPLTKVTEPTPVRLSAKAHFGPCTVKLVGPSVTVQLLGSTRVIWNTLLPLWPSCAAVIIQFPPREVVCDGGGAWGGGEELAACGDPPPHPTKLNKVNSNNALYPSLVATNFI